MAEPHQQAPNAEGIPIDINTRYGPICGVVDPRWVLGKLSKRGPLINFLNYINSNDAARTALAESLKKIEDISYNVPQDERIDLKDSSFLNSLISFFMRVGMLICLLTAVAFLAAAQFVYYKLPIDGRMVYARQAQLGEVVYVSGAVQDYVNGRYVGIVFRGVNPGMMASPWLPNSTGVEYSYTRATALFNITEVDPRRDVKWYVYNIHFTDIWEIKPVAIIYGLFAAVKSGGGPVLDTSCLKALGGGLYNYTCPQPPGPRLNYVIAYYAAAYSNAYIYKFVLVGTNFTGDIKVSGPKYYETITGRKPPKINNTVVNILGLLYNVTVRDLSTRFFCVDFNRESVYFVDVPVKCVPMADPPRNVTISVKRHNATASAVDVYVDGRPFYTFYVNGSDAVLYTGPYAAADLFMATSAAFIELNYPGKPLKPLGSALLLIGNDTMMTPPKYVLKAMYLGPGFYVTWADAVLTWSGVHVRPGSMGNNATVYQWPTVPVKIHGRATELPYKALVNVSKLCPGGAVVSGQYRWVGGWVEVRGPASIHCTEYPVEFLLPNSTSVAVQAPFNKTFVWTPPPIVYPNGTRLEADPVSVFVDGPRTVRVNYSRVFYLVRIITPLGLNETWTPRGAAAGAPAVINLGNGTRWVAEGPTSAVAEGPLVLALRYKRQYLVRLEAPVNSTEVWVDEGLTFAVGLPDPWDLPNGTRFAGLLVNGTSAREFRVDRPMTLWAQYAEVYYWASVEMPVNKTAGWTPRGAVLKFPDIINFGNGTRLAEPSVREIAVDSPVKVVVTYAKRQYYVAILGVVEWEGWVDAGAVVRLNATVVGGVEYTPAEVVTASNPGVYRPLFYAVYRTAVRDALGVPNPLATVRLCNTTAQAGLDGSAVVATYTRELCQPTVETFPISPYTAAAVATAAALALKKRRK